MPRLVTAGEAALATALAAIVIVSVAVLSPARAQQAKRPYGLAGIRLGMPLSELRQLRFVDDGTRGELRLICSMDKDATRIEQLQSFATDRPDAVRCGLFMWKDGGRARQGKILVFGEAVEPVLFLYPGPSSEPQLSEIIVTMGNERFEEIISLMRRDYGAPRDYQMSSAATAFGSLLNATYYWANEVSNIKVDLLTPDLEKMRIRLTLNDTASADSAP